MKYSILVILFSFIFSGLALAESSGKSGNIKKHSTSHQTVKAPARSDLVLQTQHQLNRLGFNSGRADGIMGKRTREAISQYQRKNHQPINGKATLVLLETLKRDKKR